MKNLESALSAHLTDCADARRENKKSIDRNAKSTLAALKAIERVSTHLKEQDESLASIREAQRFFNTGRKILLWVLTTVGGSATVLEAINGIRHGLEAMH